MNEERSAAVHAITPGRLTRFCTREGYHCQIEMPGSDVSPPEHKLHVSDWERSLQERAAARCATLECSVLALWRTALQ